MSKISNVILVHGAWVDGSSWAKVVPLLADMQFVVTVVHLPLTGFDADVAAVRRAIALAEGEIVLVGHSYAGAVITEAGNHPKVARLVYIDAFAPAAGECVGDLIDQFDAPPLNAEIRADAEGYLKLTPAGINLFAQDLGEAERAVLFATQAPINAAALGSKISQPAWESRPAFYLVGDQDQAITRSEQERMAKRIDAIVAHVESSHVSVLTRPAEVADFVSCAAA